MSEFHDPHYQVHPKAVAAAEEDGEVFEMQLN